MIDRRHGFAMAMAQIPLLGLMLFVIAPASAYQLLGGKWSTLQLNYYIDGATYQSEIGSAANSWNYYTGNKVQLSRVYGQYENIRLLTANYGATSWYATAWNSPSFQSIPYTYSQIRINSQNLSWLSYSDRQEVVAHELGHSLGLGHTNLTGCILMKAGGFCAVYPRADDINGIYALYP